MTTVTCFKCHTHTRLTALCPGLPRWAGTRKVKPIWILLKQETVSGSGISWAICKSATHSRQITTPAPHHSVFYRPDALPAAQPTASMHCTHCHTHQYWLLNSITCEHCEIVVLSTASCLQTKLEGGLQPLYSADDIATEWLKTYSL